MAVSPDGKEFWAVNINEKTITVVSFPEKKILETFPLSTTLTNRLNFTLDGKFVLITELQGTDLVVLDATTRKGVRRITVGAGGEGLEGLLSHTPRVSHRSLATASCTRGF